MNARQPRGLAAWAHRLLAAVPDPAAEPAALQLAPLAGAPPPVEAPAEMLCSRDGTCLPLRRGGCCREAWLPLRPPPTLYHSPLGIVARETVAALETVAAYTSSKPPVFTDYTDWLASRRCRPRLGCTPLARRIDVSRIQGRASLEPPGYKPRLCIPTLLGVYCGRVTRTLEIRSPAATLSTPSSCMALVCSSDCRMEIHPDKIIVDTAEAALLRGKRCSGHTLFKDALLAEAARRLGDSEATSPSLWSTGALVPVYAEVRDEKTLLLALWNTEPRPSLAELRSSTHRIVEAYTRAPSDTGWEQLRPEYDRVKIPVRPYGVTLLQLTLKPLPPLLRRSRRVAP